MNTSPVPLAQLQTVANTILAVLAPNSARLVRAGVVLETVAATASTDGHLIIQLPPAFCGHTIPDDVMVAVGLLAHEAGHFVQPLKQIQAVEAQEGVPHWLANIVLDIHGESFVAAMFPALQAALSVTRQAVRTCHLADYREALRQAPDFQSAAAHISLMGRFHDPATAFDEAWLTVSQWGHRPWFARAHAFQQALALAGPLPARQLPRFLAALIQQFPCLRRVQEPCIPTYGRSHADTLGQIALGEAQGQGGQISAEDAGTLLKRVFHPAAPEAEALRLAAQIAGRFQARRGAIDIQAPGRIDRHALARHAPLPFHMRLPGHERPAPRVVLCLDISGSMSQQKLALARIAAQAIALAVRRAEGSVAGVLFSDNGIVTARGDASPLFAPLGEWLPRGGTSFRFLTHVWRQWPDHLVLLLTDGYGDLPPVLPQDRQRTFVVLIHGEPQRVAPLARQVVELSDLKDLPQLLATLIARRHP